MRAPVLALCSLSTLLATALPARAEVVVTACAEVGAGVDVGEDTPFEIFLHRDPAEASAARLDFLAYDPDNYNTSPEVSVRIDPSAYGVPPLNRLQLGQGREAFNNRSASYSVELPTSALVQGANTVVIDDNDTGSDFLVERLCLTLLGAPPPDERPAREIFCADDVYGPDPSVAGAVIGDGSNAAPGTSVNVDVDVPVSDEARVGLDLVAYVSGQDPGTHVGGFTNGAVSLTTSFVADNDQKNDQYRIVRAPEGEGLLVGGSAAEPSSNALDVEGDYNGHLWLACLVVEDVLPPPELDAGPPDAGVEDAGLPVEDDAGPPPTGVDAGPLPDGGAPNEDAGLPPTPDAGEDEPRDAGDPGSEVPAVDDERAARAELTDPSFRVASSCASTRASDAAPCVLALLAALALRRRRHGRRASRRA